MTARRPLGLAAAFAALLPVLVSGAQQPATPPPAPSPANTVVSPEVLADGRVTFRIYAPSATEVSVRGEFAEFGRPPVPLTRADNGVWSATVGPVEPNAYRYRFTVNGALVVDPRNVQVSQDNTGVQSVVFVPGPAADFMASHAVPHGAVREVTYRSSSLGFDRRMHIYTPPGYDLGRDRYPVLYLLHGGGGSDDEWSTVGRAGFILDNLIAAGKARPMVVVMPAGHVPGVEGAQAMTASPANDKFTADLMNDVLPYVERNLRVLTEPASRAIAGLSMGGVQTLNIGMSNLDKFSQVGAFSTGWFPPVLAEFEKNMGAVLDSPATKGRLKVFFVAVGRDDQLAFQNTKNTLAMFDRHGIKYTYRESDGGHTWINWRRYLNEFAPMLFKGTVRSTAE
jgi:enterochelin esterase-like enzyme